MLEIHFKQGSNVKNQLELTEIFRARDASFLKGKKIKTFLYSIF